MFHKACIICWECVSFKVLQAVKLCWRIKSYDPMVIGKWWNVYYRYAPNGLQVIKFTDDDTDQPEMSIYFTPAVSGQQDISVLCQRDHPFFVKDKGKNNEKKYWCFVSEKNVRVFRASKCQSSSLWSMFALMSRSFKLPQNTVLSK